MIKSVWMDVSTSEDGQKVIFRKNHFLSLDKVDALVLQGGGPVSVADQVTGEVLADDQLLKL